MTAEAIARLRAARPLHDSYDGVVVSDLDLRALLDAHAALETAHTEALDEMEKLLALSDARSKRLMDNDEWADARDVLAKAGRR